MNFDTAWYRVCTFCGLQDIVWREHNCYQCNHCNKRNFINRSAAAGVFFYNDQGEVLIAKRARDPEKWKYDDPGGFVDPQDDSAESTVVREVYEELWISIDPCSLKYLDSESMNYRYQDRDVPVLVMYYYAYLPSQQQKSIVTSDDVESVQRVTRTSFYPTLMVTTKKAQCVQKVFDLVSL